MQGRRVAQDVAFMLVAASVATVPALAKDRGLARCAAVVDSAARLACFEELAQSRGAAPAARSSTATEPAAPPVTEAASAAVRSAAPVDQAVKSRAEFGLSADRIAARKPVPDRPSDRLAAVVASIEPFGAGYWTFTTRDGATWRVLEARQSFRPPRPGDTVTLLRASLGSFLMIAQHQASIRVRRLS